jgi:hypothetical protein
MSEISNVVDVKSLEDVKKGHNVISFPNIRPPVPLLDIDPKGEARQIYSNRDAGGFSLKELSQLRSLPQAAINKIRTSRKAATKFAKESFSAVGITSLTSVVVVIIVLIVVCYVYRDLLMRVWNEITNPMSNAVKDVTDAIGNTFKSEEPSLYGGGRSLYSNYSRPRSYSRPSYSSSYSRPSYSSYSRPTSYSRPSYSSRYMTGGAQTLF